MSLVDTARALLVACLVVTTQAMAAEGDSARPRSTVEQELADVQGQLSALQNSLTEQSRALVQKKHDLEYGDPEIVRIREELVALEKQVLEKRKELNRRSSLHPAIQKIEQERRELFQNLERLRAEEKALQNELKAMDYAAELPR